VQVAVHPPPLLELLEELEPPPEQVADVSGLLVSTPQLFASVQVRVLVPFEQAVQPPQLQLGLQQANFVGLQAILQVDAVVHLELLHISRTNPLHLYWFAWLEVQLSALTVLPKNKLTVKSVKTAKRFLIFIFIKLI